MSLAHELTQSLDTKSAGSNVILSLDMEKAFDKIEWSFLIRVLYRFGFGKDWIDIIKACVMNNSFSLLMNGVSSEFFKSTRGVRQGDPLSSALFIIAEEVLSKGLKGLVDSGDCKSFFVH